jgi:signal transduction histidine kinase/ActR/RegA family two-component response regulator
MRLSREAEGYISLLMSNKHWLLEQIGKYTEEYHFSNQFTAFPEKLPYEIDALFNLQLLHIKSDGFFYIGLVDTQSYNQLYQSFVRQIIERWQKENNNINQYLLFIKLCRKAYLKLFEKADLNVSNSFQYRKYTEHSFDTLELMMLSQLSLTPSENRRINKKEFLFRSTENIGDTFLFMFENLYFPIILLDKEGYILNFNQAASQLFVSMNIATNITTVENTRTPVFVMLNTEIEKFNQSDDTYRFFESPLKTHSGERYYKVFLRKNIDIEGNHRFNLLVLHDLTEQKEKEGKLQKARSKAEESDNLKTAFLANMSHEIRTPMNAIIGFTDLLLMEKYNQIDRNHFLKLIRKSGNELLHLIDDIIDITKLESKKLKIKYKRCKPFQIILDLQEVFTETLRRYGTADDVELVVNVDEDLHGLVVITDGERLKQVLNNLMSNAVKFTSRGRIEVGFHMATPNNMIFHVSDTGPGIPPEKKEHVFERFYQLEGNRTENNSGAGLGLAICKSIINLMGGHIDIDSELGKGSVFSFQIPFKPVDQETKSLKKNRFQQDEIDYPNFEGVSILVVEDDEINYCFLNEILRKTGAEIRWAKNGCDAINTIEAGLKTDLILMDIKMPEVDGLEATKTILHRRPDLPIIAQTAFALEGDQAKCLGAGCKAYITKPVNRQKLYLLLERYLEKTGTRQNHLMRTL